MNIKSLPLLVITLFVIPSAMSACNEQITTVELTNCVFLESEGISYTVWEGNFTSPSETKKEESNKEMALIISTPALRN